MQAQSSKWQLCLRTATASLVTLFITSDAVFATPAAKPKRTPEPAFGAKVTAWSLDQFSRVYGDMRLLVSPTCLKVTYSKSELVFISVAPFSEYSVFSARTGKYSTTKVATYRSLVRPVSMVSGISVTDVPLAKTGSKTIAGVKTDLYESSEAYRTQQRKYRSNNEIAGSAVSKMQLASASSLGVAPAICLAIAKVVEVPVTKGVPIECTYFDMDDEEKHHLKTYKCKSIQVPTSVFSIPKGLKFTRQVEQVNVGEGDQDALDLMLEGGRRRVENQK